MVAAQNNRSKTVGDNKIYPQSKASQQEKPIFILNGPNLNLLGLREPDIYGSETLADIQKNCHTKAKALGLYIEFYQSNNEGTLIDLCQKARTHACALIINAAAYTHTSVALQDALRMLEIPIVEVHLSNIYKRESFRHHSYISPVVQGVLCGFGAHGYLMALDSIDYFLKNSHLNKTQPTNVLTEEGIHV